MKKPRRLHPIALNVLLVLLLLFAAAELVSPTRYNLDAGTLEVTVTPSLPGGKLRLPLGPFGELSWRTHGAPLDVEANFIIARKARSFPTPADFEALPATMLRQKLPWLVIVALAAGILIGEGSRRARVLVGSLAIATLLSVGVGAGVAAAATFDADALADPRYRGPIEDAPRVLALIKEIRRDLPGTRRNIARVVAGLQRLHGDVLVRRAVPATDAVRFLVVSDVHNNPLGLLIARQMVEQFDVDAVLNAGDFTDRGTAPEGELFASLGSFGIPQVVSPGNHEDAAAVASVRRVAGATVFDQARACDADGAAPCAGPATQPQVSVAVEGITVLGVADPNAGNVSNDPFNADADRLIPAFCSALATYARDAGPGILLVHDRRVGECAATEAEQQQRPLIFVSGHDHKQSFGRRGSVVTVDPGTSGANGVKSATEGDYGFALLELDRVTKQATSVCLFTFDAPEHPKDVSCHLLDQPPQQQTGGLSTPGPSPS